MNEVMTEASSSALSYALVAACRSGVAIWDFDGVIADTEPVHDASYRILLEQRGWSPTPGYFHDLVGRTEDEIWRRLVASGFPEPLPDLETALPALKAERARVLIERAEADLQPTWVARDVMPVFARHGFRQIVISNGEARVIQRLLDLWGLSQYVEVPVRGPGEDKKQLLTHFCVAGSVVLEDNPGWIAAARGLGASTLGVAHRYNAVDELKADLLARI